MPAAVSFHPPSPNGVPGVSFDATDGAGIRAAPQSRVSVLGTDANPSASRSLLTLGNSLPSALGAAVSFFVCAMGIKTTPFPTRPQQCHP